MKSFLPALLSLLCMGLLLWTPAAYSQNLGLNKGQGRAIENGPADIEALTRRAGLIVRAIVSSREPRWIGRVIYTHYDLQVQETLKGTPRSSVTMAVAGGALGNVRLAVPGAPELRAGDQLVLFGVPLEGQASFTPVGTFDGIVSIHPANGNARAFVTPRGKSEELEDFLQEIRTLSRRP